MSETRWRHLRRSIAFLGALLGTLLVPVAAAARPGPGPSQPSFATMDRTSDASHAGGSLSFALYDRGPDLAMRIDLWGQHVTRRGYGFYAALPLSYLSQNDDSETAIANIELGGLYVLRQRSFPVILRGGLSLGTADDDLAGLAANFANVAGRLTDYANVFDVTWLRLAASPLIRQGDVFLRIDGGLDVPLGDQQYRDVDPLVRINVGAGLDTGNVALTGELVTLGTTGDTNGADRFLHSFALSGRLRQGDLEPMAALVFPLNDELGDITFILVVGLQSRL